MAIHYSTGPLENAFPDPTVHVALKAVNNSLCSSSKVQWNLFALDGMKRHAGSSIVRLRPNSSAFVSLPVDALEFEVQALVIGKDADDTLIAVFGEDGDGRPVAVHRVLNSEMTVLDRECPEGGPGSDAGASPSS